MEPHLEKNLIINNRELKYKGIFRVDELFSTINNALIDKGYQLQEKKSEETVSEAGRKTLVELRPFKIKAEYAQLMIKIKVLLDNITEIKEEIHGEKKLFQQGDVLIAFDGWVLTDYQQRWGMKPWVYFMKGVIHKFLYKFPLEAGFPRELGGDTAHVYAKIKSLLNSYKMEAGKFTPEEEIRKQVEEEIRKEIEEGEKGV